MAQDKVIEMLEAEWRDRLKAAVLAEREACAKMCESIDMEAFGVLPIRTVMITSHCADAIRAKS